MPAIEKLDGTSNGTRTRAVTTTHSFKPADEPVTPPMTVYEGSSTMSRKPRQFGQRTLESSSSTENDDDAGHFIGTDVDMLIAQTRSILIASSECLSGMIEAREQLKRYHALDHLQDRSLEAQEDGVRRRMASCNDLDAMMTNLEQSVDLYTGNDCAPRRNGSTASATSLPPRPSLMRLHDQTHRTHSSLGGSSSVFASDWHTSSIAPERPRQHVRASYLSSCTDDFMTAHEGTPPPTSAFQTFAIPLADSASIRSDIDGVKSPRSSGARDMLERLSKVSAAIETERCSTLSSTPDSSFPASTPDLSASSSTCLSEAEPSTPLPSPLDRRKVSPSSPLALLSKGACSRSDRAISDSAITMEGSVSVPTHCILFTGVKASSHAQTESSHNRRPSSALSDHLNSAKTDMLYAKGSLRKSSTKKDGTDGMTAQERLLSLVSGSHSFSKK